MRFLLLLGLAVVSFLRAHAADVAPFTRTEVIYGRKFGTALTLDVFRPASTNTLGVVAIISGGFFSSHEAINPGMLRPFLDRGYTVFAVVHGSQPRYIIPEIIGDLHRSVRWIRRHAADYGIRPDRLGVFGASAGGHLSLTLGTQGGLGDPSAKDPVDRESSAVQAVACFFPPTDYLNWRESGDDAVGVGVLKDFKPAFGPRSDTEDGRRVYGKEISPIYFVSDTLPPTYIVHGDADRLVPIHQAEIFVKRCQEAGVKAPVTLDRRPGKDHGWPGMDQDLVLFADWFDRHLR